MKLKRSDALEFVLLAALTAAVFLLQLGSFPFEGDESMWINRSSAFETFFKGEFATLAGDHSGLGLSMPTIPEYAIGLSRRAGGYQTTDLNKLWNWGKSYEENKARGNLPSEGLLWWARLLPSVLGAASILIAYYLLRAARNRPAALLWLGLALANAFITSTLGKAMSEPPMMFFLMLAAWAGYRAVQSFDPDAASNSRSLLWMVLFGACTGLAGQSKNNGLTLFAGGVILLVLMAAAARQPWTTRLKFLLPGLIGLSAATFLFFVGPNPLLWKHPVSASLELLDYRVGLLDRQVQRYPAQAIGGWQDGLQVVPGQIFGDLGSFQFPGASLAGAGLFCLGLAIMAAGAWQAWKAGRIDAAALAIFAAGISAAPPTLFTPLNWPRYFLIPVFFVTMFIAVGLDYCLRALWRAGQRLLRARKPTPAG